jgi:hypothetical protein
MRHRALDFKSSIPFNRISSLPVPAAFGSFSVFFSLLRDKSNLGYTPPNPMLIITVNLFPESGTRSAGFLQLLCRTAAQPQV